MIDKFTYDYCDECEEDVRTEIVQATEDTQHEFCSSCGNLLNEIDLT